MDPQQLADRYWEALQDHLRDHGEDALHRGYELARTALVGGIGILDLADIHHRSLQRMLTTRPADAPRLVAKAGAFFAECLSPFEMSHRGAQEGTRALRRVNELLEAELKRVAHALHDEAGQLLATVHLAIAELVEDLPDRGGEHLVQVEQLLKQIEAELRNLSHELRPTVLDNLGLSAALEFLAEKVAKRTGIVVSVVGDAGPRLPQATETALYRIVQEALNNAVKHARAHAVTIELAHTATAVSCTVRDDGVGFRLNATRIRHGLGLGGIRERLDALGGALHITSRPGGGTLLRADVPLISTKGTDAHALPRTAGG